MKTVLIMSGEFFQVSMAKEILEDNNSPCAMQSEHGDWLSIQLGSKTETFNLIVAEENSEKAINLLDSVFQSADDEDSDENFDDELDEEFEDELEEE